MKGENNMLKNFISVVNRAGNVFSRAVTVIVLAAMGLVSAILFYQFFIEKPFQTLLAGLVVAGVALIVLKGRKK
jgi:hypothetical protein